MDKEIKKTVKTLGVFSTIGMAMALSIALGALIGYYIDKTFKTQPWFLLIFLGIGIAAAFRNLYILYKKASKL
jgi:ATP synthase protein I